MLSSYNLRYDSEKVSAVYLFYLFNDHNFRKTIQGLGSGAAASMPNISQEKLLMHEVPLPSLVTQMRFENIVLCTFRKIKILNTSLSQLTFLKNSILQKAFNGQLNFNVDFELNALIKEIDLQSKENDLTKISSDIAYLQRLVDKLNNQEFEEQDLYDKAKSAAFQLLRSGEKIEHIAKMTIVSEKEVTSLMLSLK